MGAKWAIRVCAGVTAALTVMRSYTSLIRVMTRARAPAACCVVAAEPTRAGCPSPNPSADTPPTAANATVVLPSTPVTVAANASAFLRSITLPPNVHDAEVIGQFSARSGATHPNLCPVLTHAHGPDGAHSRGSASSVVAVATLSRLVGFVDIIVRIVVMGRRRDRTLGGRTDTGRAGRRRRIFPIRRRRNRDGRRRAEASAVTSRRGRCGSGLAFEASLNRVEGAHAIYRPGHKEPIRKREGAASENEHDGNSNCNEGSALAIHSPTSGSDGLHETSTTVPSTQPSTGTRQVRER